MIAAKDARPEVVEPESATWSVEPTRWRWMHIVANASDRNVMIRRDYADNSAVSERVELHVDDIEPLIDALRNALAWHERARAQRLANEPEVPF